MADLSAGFVVGIVALPLAIAFAIASGATPEAGLFTAILGGFIISALGGSRVQIGGPTGAFVVVVYGVIQQYGMDGLTVATIMPGVMLVILGVAKLGGAIKFIPYPVTTGFTSGIAVIIFTSQVKDFLGLRMATVPADFVGKWRAFAENIGSLNGSAIGVALGSLAILMLWPKVSRRIPAPFVALIAGTAAVTLLHLPVETIGDRFGEIRASFPAPHIPVVSLEVMRGLIGPAFTIAMLAAIESLLSAVVADGMIGGRHRSNMELVAQGVANIVSPIFGGIPATGAIARTATNVKNGGHTPIAGIIHAITLLLITLFFGKMAALIPMAVLAAILVVVSYNMSQWRSFMAEVRATKSDVLVLLTTFLLTVLVDLTAAVEAGMVLAAFLFGAAESFKTAVSSVARKPEVLIIRMRRVPVIDSTGLAALRDVVDRCRREGTLVILSDVHSQPVVALTNSAFFDELGQENLLGNLDDALDRARVHLGLPALQRFIPADATVARETAHGERRKQPRL